MKKLFLLLVLSSFFSFSQDNVQVQKPKLSVIELEKVKVVYRGIPNPIKIAVPNNVKSFTVSGDGVSPTETKGKYVIKPTTGKEVKVKVAMVLANNSVVNEEHIYRILPMPSLNYTINNQFSDGAFLLTKAQIKNAEIGVGCEGLILDGFTSEIICFDIKVPGFKTETVEGNKITDKVYNIILKAKKEDVITVFEIKGTMTLFPVIPRQIPMLTFKIID